MQFQEQIDVARKLSPKRGLLSIAEQDEEQTGL